MTKQNRNGLTENNLTVVRRVEVGELGEKCKGVKKYKWVVIK